MQRVHEYVADSPFEYQRNCLLYLPKDLKRCRRGSQEETEMIADHIHSLICSTYGHTLVLFTSYHLMGNVYQMLRDEIPFPMIEVWRHSPEETTRFKQTDNAVLFAAGSCWEGVDFPGDMVSSLIIVKLPFAVPDPISEAQKKEYDCLKDYIQAVVVPDMQKKLRQGFGRALRTETDTCVVSILDERAGEDGRYHEEQIQWNANVWYLERLHLGKHRVDESKSLKSISFMEVQNQQNREILQAYMKYELGITGQAVSTIVRRFIFIRNFIEMLEQEKILVTGVTAENVKTYADDLLKRGIQAKGFNERIFGIGHFYKFMEVRQYIKKVPFRIEYFQQKEVLVHHDRSVEETVYMEILKKLYLFPERLRCMFLHLWCLGLRASEVCTLKGNAYYQKNGDYWIQVYQVKMKNYKRIPIPQALYEIMKIYLEKHEIQPEDYIFQNIKGGACLYNTFRHQMLNACKENKIAGGEYIFRSHDYRHTVATILYDSEVSVQSIRDYLGHTYEEMTRQYIDYMPKKIAQANEEFFEMQGSSLVSCLKERKEDGKMILYISGNF